MRHSSMTSERSIDPDHSLTIVCRICTRLIAFYSCFRLHRIHLPLNAETPSECILKELFLFLSVCFVILFYVTSVAMIVFNKFLTIIVT